MSAIRLCRAAALSSCLVAVGCSGDDGTMVTADSAETLGDGDGDPGETGDGDGGDGDGDPGGDGDGDTGEGDGDGDTGDGDGDPPDPGFGPWCEPPPACDAAPPAPGPELDWQHLDSNLIVLAGDPQHRVRDMFYVPGETQWLLGKFTYGTIDKDLKDERVDVYVMRDCAGPWEFMGEAWTTEEGSHATVEGVEDTGGWVYLEIPADQELELGRHRVHMVVRGDASTAEGIIEVVEPGTPIFLSDVDGTLTTFETEEFVDLLLGVTPDANPQSAAALSTLQDKGYHAMYLTARPEFLVERTREFIEVRGFPPGVIHTSLELEGALGDAAVDYKTGELEMLAGKGLIPTYVFGNTDSDAEAYDNAGLMPLDHRVFFQFTDPWGGRRIESYAELVPEFEALADLCE
ncbi:LNS2 (Lipin/Ned1/Smp2) [Enhygromyxa salina]|uniref:LNS2 (Lipin/Ned1/Smp2) n=1 Tax=Enhygromyxa salina TaxID=215803 RepID=A0A2S9XBR1_9BACT|nr:phosphatidylinositol transfer protein [Enhygromyxa salina]PRP90240.1 LNS2 (Lipin/Ned1/Smp2) [Enhygromyxa salina]